MLQFASLSIFTSSSGRRTSSLLLCLLLHALVRFVPETRDPLPIQNFKVREVQLDLRVLVHFNIDSLYTDARRITAVLNPLLHKRPGLLIAPHLPNDPVAALILGPPKAVVFVGLGLYCFTHPYAVNLRAHYFVPEPVKSKD